MLKLQGKTRGEPDAKLNIFGIFDQINSKVFPARHSEFFVVGRLKPEIKEFGNKSVLSVKLMNGDGITLHQVTGQIIFGKPKSGVVPAVNFLMRINDYVFEKVDTYEICLYIDEVKIVSTPLNLNLSA